MTNIVIADLVDALQIDLFEIDSATGLPAEVDYDEDNFLPLALQNALSEIRLKVDIGGPLLTDVDDSYEALIRVWAIYNIVQGHLTKLTKEFKFSDQSIDVDKTERQKTLLELLKQLNKRRMELLKDVKDNLNLTTTRFATEVTDWS